MRQADLERLYNAFVAKDMSLLEINPLVVTEGGDVVCLDAKINFDDNAASSATKTSWNCAICRGRGREGN